MKFELIAKPYTYVDKKGNQKKGVNFYLRAENGNEIRIQSYHQEYKDGKVVDTYQVLRTLATLEKE